MKEELIAGVTVVIMLLKVKIFFLALDRQVQLTIGSFVFFGSLLTYFVDPKFAFIPTFFGAGLIFAWLSGLVCWQI